MKLPQTIFAVMEKQRLRNQSRNAEISLKASEERYKKILDNVLMGVYQVALDGSFIFANQKMINLLGYASYDDLAAIGSIINLYVRPEERGPLVDTVLHKGFIIKQFEFRRKDGQSVWVRLNARKSTDKSGAVIIEGLMEDVTQLKKIEARLHQAQKIKALGTLSGGIAHDFNNILSSVIGFGELAMEDAQPETLLYDNLNEILIAGRRAKDLVKQIMTFSRHDEQEKIQAPLNPMVKESIRMLRSTIPTAIEIRERISQTMLSIHANPSQIHQVLINLVTNASHAVDENGVIEISLEPITLDDSIQEQNTDLLPGRYAQIIVSDNGCGIAPEHLGQIFDPYFTTKDQDKGTGLGLAVAHGIVKIHKGQITAYSEMDKGTTFNVYLPLSNQAVPLKSNQPPEELPMGTEHVLIVDDEVPIVKMQKRHLSLLGYTVETQTSSLEALKIIRQSPDRFDLIITDMNMPNMTGEKLALSIKKIRPDMPVILCSGFSEKVNAKTADQMPVDGFLMKPMDQKKMTNLIRKVLDKDKIYHKKT
ncbi:MAG: response regulator [Desulfobacula sp.]|jgi:PAS domain S-box-containing protein|uniref:hybrid sensor histidine kinase/response regulator n=1 Tax=Desulfobacula sp. TaxID=2593537 RepID=UPI001D2D1F65|nr:response regulator [Desulfobacula sp.]MBT3483637.1 response regulator [Desulfobacula sp.]MBT3804918.1 response regulator [Desulfobacula sp.]MBT4023380.1 response regulator [Desulfobacula sp.]MBT4197366.1 response regulator [Desulfobacula sp.]